MRRSGLWLGLSVLVFTVTLGCDTSTDLSEVTVQGTWDGVGAMQESFSGARMILSESSDGVISGTWRRSSAGIVGSQVTGMNENGAVRLELHGFSAGSVVFEGGFRDGFTMEGSLDGASLNGPAVFRRYNFDGGGS